MHALPLSRIGGAFSLQKTSKNKHTTRLAFILDTLALLLFDLHVV